MRKHKGGDVSMGGKETKSVGKYLYAVISGALYRGLSPEGRSSAFYDTLMSGPLPYQPGKTEPPVDQGNKLIVNPPRFPSAQEKTCISRAGPVTRHATVRRNVV